MAKFHIKENGEPGVCKAEPGKCPLGVNNPHFETKQEARQHYEQQQEQEIFTSNKKVTQRDMQKMCNSDDVNTQMNIALRGTDPTLRKLLNNKNLDGAAVFYAAERAEDDELRDELKRHPNYPWNKVDAETVRILSSGKEQLNSGNSGIHRLLHLSSQGKVNEEGFNAMLDKVDEIHKKGNKSPLWNDIVEQSLVSNDISLSGQKRAFEMGVDKHDTRFALNTSPELLEQLKGEYAEQYISRILAREDGYSAKNLDLIGENFKNIGDEKKEEALACRLYNSTSVLSWTLKDIVYSYPQVQKMVKFDTFADSLGKESLGDYVEMENCDYLDNDLVVQEYSFDTKEPSSVMTLDEMKEYIDFAERVDDSRYGEIREENGFLKWTYSFYDE